MQEKYRSIYKKYLHSAGMNITPERLDILDKILEHDGHFRIEDILNSSSGKISQATLYRTMKTIEEAGIIKSIRFCQNEKVYELSGRHHDHMICRHCGAIIEFYDESLERLQTEICNRHGFHPDNHIMKVFGICEACRKKHK